ncbi:DsbA family oxidoreductase [Marinomonas agarivorans]|nr:DsbA family oxidoreductase [Marinomonas agarivorans]
MADFRIDIITDVVCPLGYLGYTRLKQAMEHLGDDYRFDVYWQPLELHDNIPVDGVDRMTYLSQRFGSEERLNETDHALQQVGAEAGIEFNFNDKTVLPNTRLAHQLVQVANKKQQSTNLMLALYHNYFTELKDVGNKATLQDIALQVGLTQEDIDSAFSDKMAKQVIQKIEHFKRLEIETSPTYVFNDKFVIHGPHQAEDFAKVIVDIANKST